MRNSTQPGDFLSEVRSLRFFPGSEEDFWPRFLSGVSNLCKSTWVLRLIRDNSDSWSLAQDYGADLDKNQIRDTLQESLVQIANRARTNGYAFERLRRKIPGFVQPTAIAFSVEEGGNRKESIIIGFVDRLASPQVNDILVRSQLIADIPRSYFSTGFDREEGTDQNFLDVLEIVSSLTHQKRYLLSCMKLVNELSSKFHCSRVSIGWVKGEYVYPVAISHLEKFDKHMDAVTQLQTVFEESLDQDEEIIVPGEVSQGTISAAHQSYLRTNGLKQILSLPLRVDDEPVAVVSFERIDSFFHEREMLTLRLAMNQVAPLLLNLKQTDRWLIVKAAFKLRDWFGWWFGVEKIALKLGVIGLTFCLLYILIGKWEFEVEATAQLATDQVIFMAAPFDGIVFKVNTKEGESVKKDQVLLELDTQDLYLRETEARSEVTRFTRESQKARVDGKLADMSIADAKVEQAKAQLERILYFLNRAVLKAPFDGVLIEGDQDELQGAPVTKGEVIFKIAQLTGIFLELKVHEEDIDLVREDSTGELALLSDPSKKFSFQVERIVPVAQIDQTEGNTFLVRARLAETPRDWWRPGMSGVTRIKVGERRILWILSRKFIDFLRLKFWI